MCYFILRETIDIAACSRVNEVFITELELLIEELPMLFLYL